MPTKHWHLLQISHWYTTMTMTISCVRCQSQNPIEWILFGLTRETPLARLVILGEGGWSAVSQSSNPTKPARGNKISAINSKCFLHIQMIWVLGCRVSETKSLEKMIEWFWLSPQVFPTQWHAWRCGNAIADFEASEWHWASRRSWWIWDCYSMLQIEFWL